MSNPPKVWVIRGIGTDGRNGKEYAVETKVYAIKNNIAVIGWTDKFSDLTTLVNENELGELFRKEYGQKHQNAPDSGLNQLKRFRFEIQLDDFVLMPLKPMKSNDYIAIGIVTREYYYEDEDDFGQELCHRIGVDWNPEFVPHEEIPQDIRKSLGRQATVYLIEGTNSETIKYLKHNLKRGGKDYRSPTW